MNWYKHYYRSSKSRSRILCKASFYEVGKRSTIRCENISGVFTGAHAIHPFTGEKVAFGLAIMYSYGSGAVMAVPCGDQRDWDFAQHFGIDIINIFQDVDVREGVVKINRQ